MRFHEVGVYSQFCYPQTITIPFLHLPVSRLSAFTYKHTYIMIKLWIINKYTYLLNTLYTCIAGELIWFNQAHSTNASCLRANPSFQKIFADVPDDKLHFNTYYGDGSELEPEVLQHIRNVSWKAAVGFQLRKNEMIAMDNMYVQHGRLSFEGKRRLLASMI